MMRMLIMPLMIVMMVIDGDGDKGDATIVEKRRRSKTCL